MYRLAGRSTLGRFRETLHPVVDARSRCPSYEEAMEPQEIFELIVKADEKLKYATDDNRPVRERQARELLERALADARAIGNDALVTQAEVRLADLGEQV
jgi:hypothetical protein